MSPKKPILLYCPNADLLSSIAFVLRLHHYEVTAVSECEDAVRTSTRDDVVCGVLIHAQQGDLAGRVIHRILECASRIPLLLVDLAGDLAPVRYADLVLYGRNTSTAHILASLQVLCQRKASPAPGSAA